MPIGNFGSENIVTFCVTQVNGLKLSMQILERVDIFQDATIQCDFPVIESI